MSLSDLTLKGEGIEATLGSGITQLDEELTIEGSPTLSLGLLDGPRELLDSGLLDHDGNGRLDAALDVRLSGVHYRLAGISKSGDSFGLTFEDRTVGLLREQRGAFKVDRGAMTHVDFARLLVERVRARFVTGEPGPVEKALTGRSGRLASKRRREEQDDRRKPGIADAARVTVKGVPADTEQLRVMNDVMTEAVRHDPPTLALVTLVAAIIIECEFRNVQGSGADRISYGVIQNIPGTSAGVNGTFTREQALDIAYSVKSALLPPGPTSAGGLIKVANQRPTISPGELADICINGVGVGDPGYVGKVNGRQEEARRIIEAYTGGTLPSTGSGGSSRTRIPQLTRGTPDAPNEDSWTCLQRIAGDYGYRCFAVDNAIYYLSDESLMGSRPRMTLSEDAAGVDWIDWEWSPRKAVNQTTVSCRAAAWQAPPGSVVVLEECGPADGRWLVSSFSRSRFSPQASIELRRGTELLRPKIPTETVEQPTRGGSGGSGETGSSSSPVQQMMSVTLDARYSGTQSIFDQFVTPFMRQRGLNAGSAKRSPAENASVGGSPTSDHLSTNSNSYAIDYPTSSGEGAARELASAMGHSGWQPDSYDRFTITVGGRSFSVQILWGGAIDHGDHVHVGIRVG